MTTSPKPSPEAGCVCGHPMGEHVDFPEGTWCGASDCGCMRWVPAYPKDAQAPGEEGHTRGRTAEPAAERRAAYALPGVEAPTSEPAAAPPPDLAPTGAESAPAPAIPTKPMAKAGDAIKQGDGPGYDTLADRGVQESAVPPAELADAAMLVRRWAPAIAAQIDALIREWPAVPARAEVPRCPHGAPIHACDAPSAAPAPGEPRHD